jgi:CheY-specific phosphatase CheX
MSVELSSEVLIQSMDAAVTDTLEKMFFSESFPAPDASPGDDPVRSVVGFSGDAAGWLELSVAATQATMLAADFLGIERSEVNTAEVESVCGEMANMICGSLVSTVAPTSRFALSHPEITESVQPAVANLISRGYQTETGNLRVLLHVSPPPLEVGI